MCCTCLYHPLVSAFTNFLYVQSHHMAEALEERASHELIKHDEVIEAL